MALPRFCFKPWNQGPWNQGSLGCAWQVVLARQIQAPRDQINSLHGGQQQQHGLMCNSGPECMAACNGVSSTYREYCKVSPTRSSLGLWVNECKVKRHMYRADTTRIIDPYALHVPQALAASHMQSLGRLAVQRCTLCSAHRMPRCHLAHQQSAQQLMCNSCISQM